MRVLHIIPAIAPRYGGPSQSVLELCESLQRRGVDAEICTTDADGRGQLSVELGKPTMYQGVRCHFARRDWSEAFKYSHSMQRWLDEHLTEFDVVHIHAVFSHSTYAAARACRQHGIPYIVRPLGTLEPWSMQQKRLRKLIAWNLVFHRVLQQAAAVHYTTDQERELTESTLNLRNGIVIANGVSENLLQAPRGDAWRQRIGIPARSPFLLSLSRLHPKKGLDLLLKAFVELKAQGHLAGWHLVVAGDGETPYVNHLRTLPAKSAAEPFVHWVGWLEGETKMGTLAEAGLFVLSSFQENFGIGALEAMACGTPVLVSRQVGLAAQVLQSQAGWVVDLNPDGLRKGILEATANPAGLSARGAAARTLVAEQFTWPRIAAQWAAHYERILGREVERIVNHECASVS
jgi:glycosyltransferase involved in cell wall biosynthesis